MNICSVPFPSTFFRIPFQQTKTCLRLWWLFWTAVPCLSTGRTSESFRSCGSLFWSFQSWPENNFWGIIKWGPILGGDQTMQIYGDVEGFLPYNNALFGLVIYQSHGSYGYRKHPAPPGMYKALYTGINHLSTGAGSLPSTVWVPSMGIFSCVYIYIYIYITPKQMSKQSQQPRYPLPKLDMPLDGIDFTEASQSSAQRIQLANWRQYNKKSCFLLARKAIIGSLW